jgi:hypothetical protein
MAESLPYQPVEHRFQDGVAFAMRIGFLPKKTASS